MTNMFRGVLAAAALLPAVPALAGEPQTLTRDGVTYIYTVETHNGTTLISGKDAVSSRPFKLAVRNGMVSGMVDGSSVEFRVRDAVRSSRVAAAADTQLVSR